MIGLAIPLSAFPEERILLIEFGRPRYEKAGGEHESPTLAGALGSCREDGCSSICSDPSSRSRCVCSFARGLPWEPTGCSACCWGLFLARRRPGDWGHRRWCVSGGAHGETRSPAAWFACWPDRRPPLMPLGCAL